MLKGARTQNCSRLHTRFAIAAAKLLSAETWEPINRAVVGSIISLCTFGVAAQQAAAQTYVQGNSATPQTAQTTVMLPYNAVQTAGNLNLVVVGWNDTTAQVSSVTDSKGNVYSLAVGPTLLSTAAGGPLTQSIYYAKNIAGAAAGANVVKVAFTAAAVFADIRVLEYSGIDPVNPVDVAVGASGNSTTSSSGSVTTTSATDLLVGANTVNGPGDSKVSTSAAAFTAATRVVWSFELTAF